MKHKIIKLFNTQYILDNIRKEDRQLFINFCRTSNNKCNCCWPFNCGDTKESNIAKNYFNKLAKNK